MSVFGSSLSPTDPLPVLLFPLLGPLGPVQLARTDASLVWGNLESLHT